MAQIHAGTNSRDFSRDCAQWICLQVEIEGTTNSLCIAALFPQNDAFTKVNLPGL